MSMTMHLEDMEHLEMMKSLLKIKETNLGMKNHVNFFVVFCLINKRIHQILCVITNVSIFRWRTQFFISQPTLFGKWDGVFTTTMVNIFGVIVFLRSGWIVAQAGIVDAMMVNHNYS